MFTPLDDQLFSDCDVYEYAPSKFVYTIFKNGRSSIMESDYQLVPVNELHTLDKIDVIIRDPYQRYLSGVQTYLTHNPTGLQTIKELLFLNSHFSLQWHWIVSIARYVHNDTKLEFHSFGDIDKFIDAEYLTAKWGHSKINEIKKDSNLDKHFRNDQRLHYYLLADKFLFDQIGKTLTVEETLLGVKNNYPELYQTLVGLPKELVNVLP